ncbi:ABC transporter substrate-binding protein [Capnocytophaga canimorsus]|uniref:ABC transporter substrate-binding protein n=1 Tax=Capnocytophaga canimorsus TaxID=28188 RepID=A0A250G1E8_9FLAO|nr:sodium/solute symporter [Capnocytophaga canimorsus]ATA91220.1 ABC transporter substrate-binding protein [Capnocytophaga canimorsus]
MIRKFLLSFVALCFSHFIFSQDVLKHWIDWQLESIELPNSKGLNGAFVGKHNGVIIFAGGTNFPEKPVYEGGKKVWYSEIYTFHKEKSGWQVKTHTTKLPNPLANGVAISTEKGIYCFGGDNAQSISKSTFLLKWDDARQEVTLENLPDMPYPLAHMGGAHIAGNIYLVGGQRELAGDATKSFLSFSITSSLENTLHQWRQLPDFEAEARIQPVVVAQSDGKEQCLYVFSGANSNAKADISYKMLGDVHAYSPKQKQWRQKQSVPNNGTPQIDYGYIAAAPALKMGDSHIVIFGGAGGKNQYLYQRLQLQKQLSENQDPNIIDSIKQKSKELLQKTTFSQTIWAYHTITDTWVAKGEFPSEMPVVTSVIQHTPDELFMAGGELRPGQRTSAVWSGKIQKFKPSFGWINYLTLIAYLGLMIFIGWYFSKNNKSTADYFLGGGRIPWWAAGLSIYATMLSAITYLSQPALAYSFDWQAYLGYFTIILIVPIVITFYLPFYRKLKITTAYEYLEKRFNVSIRMFGSASFMLFQLVRMGIVVYLPALAISTVTGMDIYTAIVVMGVLSVVYTVMGGMEAVIWTDVIQIFVLIGGLIIGLVYIGYEIGGIGKIYDIAIANDKFRMFDWRLSTTEVVTWSIFLGSFALNFAPYTTDQAVVQRYMTTSDEKQARKSIWMNGIIAIPAGILIFLMGTFLFVYFKENPQYINVGMANDGIFPLFIVERLPQGVAGLVIAGIFSASMSSLDSSIHSISTAFTVDWYKRFSKTYSETQAFKVAKWVTILVGIFGTLVACLMAMYPVTSLFFFFQEVVGLFGSALAGIFILGIFFRRTNAFGAVMGAVLSVLSLVFVKYYTSLNFYIYPLIAIPVCIISGVIFSYCFPQKKEVSELVYSKKGKKNI